jgi:HlyD family secretion protein
MPESEKKKSGERGPKKKKRQAKLFIATSDPYKPKARKVTAGLAGDEYTEITGGLKAGETILVRSKSLKPKPEADEVAEDDSAS